MGLFSKLWSGFKKHIKRVARTVKKLSKKIITSLPGGKLLWKTASTIGTKILSTVGKVTNSLGPLGMIALNILAPYAAPLWAGFGAAAQAASAAGSFWGSVGSAIYNGINWAGGTLSAMTKGISDGIGLIAKNGISGLAKGSLSKGFDIAAKGFADAFTGRAGTVGIQKGIEAAGQSILEQAAGNSVWKQTQDQIVSDLTGKGTTAEISASQANSAIEARMQPYNPNNPLAIPQQSSIANPIDQGIAQGTIPSTAKQQAIAKSNVSGILQSSGGQYDTTLKTSQGSLLKKAAEIGKGLLQQPIVTTQTPQIYDVGGNRFSGNAFGRGGLGAAGGTFLSDAMIRQMQEQQQRMAIGFGG